MKQRLFEIKSNEQIAKNVYRMQLAGDTADILPGQFVNIRVQGQFLRRPISVCNVEQPLNNATQVLTIIYKVVGVGTEAMSHLPVGTQLDVLTVLGNGYDLTKAGDAPLLVGGGVGVPPMYMLCRKLIEMGKKVTNKPQIFNVNWFRTDDEGNFIWPGFGDNIRVLDWILKRCNGEVEAQEVAIGYIPFAKDINVEGLDIDEKVVEELLSVDKATWLEEVKGIKEFYAQFGDRLPKELEVKLAELEANLSK